MGCFLRRSAAKRPQLALKAGELLVFTLHATGAKAHIIRRGYAGLKGPCFHGCSRLWLGAKVRGCAEGSELGRDSGVRQTSPAAHLTRRARARRPQLHDLRGSRRAGSAPVLPLSVYLIGMPVLKNVAAIAKGMSITFREMFQPTIVENYPDGPGPLKGAKFQARFRGTHVLQRDENGLEKCVACFLCAANCPSNCIYIEAAENTAEHRVSGAERYAKVYNIDYNRCIFCGYCVEACPTDAITHGHGFEVASFNVSGLIYRKEQLLAPMPAHMGANAVFNQDEVGVGTPALPMQGS